MTIPVASLPASAHTSIVKQGDDQAVTDPDHLSGSVCDLEKDDTRVIAHRSRCLRPAKTR
jgi:hypothetical protein